jgi:hypothetical protein
VRLWSPEFWSIVGVTATVATFLATAAAVATAAWWRWLDRREADWAFFGAASQWSERDAHGNQQGPSAETRLANAGDGTAFRMEIRGRHCTVQMNGEPVGQWQLQPQISLMPAVHPGEGVNVRVTCDPRMWHLAAVEICWRRSPTWRKFRSRRRAVVPLEDIVARPDYLRHVFDNQTNATVQTKVVEPTLPPLSDEDQRALEAEHRILSRLRAKVFSRRRTH